MHATDRKEKKRKDGRTAVGFRNEATRESAPHREMVPGTVLFGNPVSWRPVLILHAGAAAVGATDAAAAHAVGAGLQLRNFVRTSGLRVPATSALALGTRH